VPQTAFWLIAGWGPWATGCIPQKAMWTARAGCIGGVGAGVGHSGLRGFSRPVWHCVPGLAALPAGELGTVAGEVAGVLRLASPGALELTAAGGDTCFFGVGAAVPDED